MKHMIATVGDLEAAKDQTLRDRVTLRESRSRDDPVELVLSDVVCVQQLVFTIEMLVRALYPFADVCKGLDWSSITGRRVRRGGGYVPVAIRAAHFYFARALLERIAGGDREAFRHLMNEVYFYENAEQPCPNWQFKTREHWYGSDENGSAGPNGQDANSDGGRRDETPSDHRRLPRQD